MDYCCLNAHLPESSKELLVSVYIYIRFICITTIALPMPLFFFSPVKFLDLFATFLKTSALSILTHLSDLQLLLCLTFDCSFSLPASLLLLLFTLFHKPGPLQTSFIPLSYTSFIHLSSFTKQGHPTRLSVPSYASLEIQNLIRW